MEFSRRGLLGAGMARLIDPVEHINRTGDESLGYVPQREIVRRQDSQGRLDAQSDRTQRFFNFKTAERWCFDAAANTDTLMGDIMAASASTISLMTITDDVPQQCRVTNFEIKSTNVVNAGSAIPVLFIYDGADTTEYVINACELGPSGESRKASAVFDFPFAIQIAKDAAWAVYLRTSAAYTSNPAGADFKVSLTFCYDQWISS